MQTQSYTISFFGLDPQYYTNASIGDVWKEAAGKVYQETGIAITGEVHERYFVSPNIEEQLNGTTIFLIESKKDIYNEVTDQDYWNAYRTVAKEARTRLGNPKSNLIVQTVDITYFEKI